MRNNRLWQRVVATALAVVLALPVAGIGSVKQAEAKTVTNVLVEEDFADADYSQYIASQGAATLAVVDGALKVTGGSNQGVRAVGVPVEEGHLYQFSYKVSMQTPGASTYAYVQAYYIDEETEEDSNYMSPNYFTPAEAHRPAPCEDATVSVQYTIPSGCNRIQFVIYENDGVSNFEFFLDDFRITEDVEQPSLIANGNFGEESADTTGWDVEVSEKEQVVDVTEIVKNGDFDDANAAYSANWNSTAIIAGEGVDGSSAQSLQSGALYYTSGTPIFVAGTEYTVSFDARSTGTAIWRCYIDNLGAGATNWQILGDYDGTTEWEKYQYKFTPTEATAWPQLGFQVVGGSGVLYIDNFSVTCEEPKTELVYTQVNKNGDFDDVNAAYSENWNSTAIVAGEGVDGSSAQSLQSGALYYTSATPIFVAGTKYVVSFDARSTGTAIWRCYIDNLGAGATNWQILGDYDGTTEWQTYQYEFTPTEATAWPQLGFQVVGGSGVLYIDNFSVSSVDETPVYIYTDGVGEFGRDGYGLKITDNTATAYVGTTETIYDYSVWVKLEQGANVTLLANGAQEVASSDKADGEWINLSGVFVAEDGLETFGVEAEGTVYVDDVEVYAHVHDLVLVKGKAANCTDPGVKEHYVCSLCDLHFQDEAGTIALTEEDYVIPAKGHQYRKVTTKASYKKAGKIVEICDCGKVKSTTVIYAPTSITASSKKYNKKSQTTTIVVKDSKGKVIPSSEYTVSGNKATKVGTYTATVTFKGSKYTGKMSVKWKIYPLGTSIKSVKSLRKSLRITWSSQKSETSGYKIQVSTDKHFKKSVKTVKISKNKSTYTTIKGLKAYKKYYIRICTYKGSYVSSWSKVKTAKTR